MEAEVVAGIGAQPARAAHPPLAEMAVQQRLVRQPRERNLAAEAAALKLAIAAQVVQAVAV